MRSRSAPPWSDRARDPAARDLVHPQRDPPVVEAHEIAGLQIRRQAGVFDGDRAGRAGGAFRQRHRLPVGDLRGQAAAGANLRALQVLQHRDRLSARARFRAQGGDPSGVLLVRAVREVQSRDVHPRVDQGAYRLDVVGRRSQRTDDLGVAQAHVRWHLRELNGGFQCRA